ncbi:hypothetical protein ABI125_11750 [Tamlana crocina]
MNSKIIKMNLFALCFLAMGNLWAQNKLTKVSQSIKVDKNVVIDLNSSHCNIVFDTWNKDVVEIEAYLEGEKLSDEALQKALKSWKVDVDATQNQVSINAAGGGSPHWVMHADDDVKVILKELKYELAEMPEMDFDVHVVEVPEIPELPEVPEMPELPELPEGIHSFHFDYEAYKKDGEKYLKKYTEQFESKFGKDFEEKMQAWGEKFGKEWGERYAERMERHAERMEAQAERHAEHAERIAEAHQARMEAHKERAKEHAKERDKKVIKIIEEKSSIDAKKTIKIKMPKKAKLKVNVRYGEIEFAANVDNLKANVSHAKFKAQRIDGSLTSINASYSPVFVSHWNLGELNLNYVKRADLEHVNHLVLNAVSSNADVGKLSGSAVIDGNIGDLSIAAIDDTFYNLNVILQNSNAIIALPKVECNVTYKGTHSQFSHPKNKTKGSTSNFSSTSLNSGKSIVVNAKYSDVVMK